MKESVRNIINNLNLLRYIVSKRVKLNYFNRGLCPFHEEKTPSFSIYQGKDRARFHCFGCGADGDIFNYLYRTEKLGFILALKKLNLIFKQDISLSPFPTEFLAEPVGYVTNCFLNCENYSNLKRDYEILLEENQKLRVWLNLREFNLNKKEFDYV